VTQLIELLVVLADPLSALGVALFVTPVRAGHLVGERLHTFAHHVLHVFEGSFDFGLDLFGAVRVRAKFVVKYLCGVQSVVGVVPDHALKDVFERLGRVHLAVYFPEVLLAFDDQLFVVRVVRVRSSEGLEFQSQQEQCDGC